jgi:hypothetical protein
MCCCQCIPCKITTVCSVHTEAEVAVTSTGMCWRIDPVMKLRPRRVDALVEVLVLGIKVRQHLRSRRLMNSSIERNMR